MKRIKLIALLLATTLLFSCSKKKEIKMSANIESESKSRNEKISDFKVTFQESTNNMIMYNNQNAIKYAKDYAGQNNNSCGVYNNSDGRTDCAHFIAHCLKQGGIEIKAQTPDLSICKDGLCFRVSELTTALKNLSNTYTNVQEITMDDAIVGDYGFFKIPTVRPTHAFMVCQPAADLDNMKIYAHTNNRACDKAEPHWYQFFGAAYRITDAN